MQPVITAFAQSPDRGRGLARDMAVRWALEEVGQPYDVRLLSFAQLRQPDHRALHPFGQIPTYEDGEFALFESAAIVLHIGERHAGLLREDAAARARAIMWMFAAKSTVEPPIVERSMAVLFEKDRPWHADRLAMLDDRVRCRLAGSDLLEAQPVIAAYVARGETRPAFQRAFAAQRAVFAAAAGA